MKKYVCIHGHFYQPPRENAWLEDVEVQDSAYPFHDWNERIAAEGYAPNTASRILDSERRIIDIINNYSKISFNVGPTLFSWMEKKKPDVYHAIIEADKLSRKNFSGHGSAIAQVYNHMIMPLANPRDKRTQIIWGLQDFEYRFGRKPEGMWLPETAVDLQTLDILVEHGILFTILSPYQAKRIRKFDQKEWSDVKDGKIDPRRPYRCKLPSGNYISLFFYDGPISQDLGFGDLLNNGENFANRLIAALDEKPGEPQLVHIATDGETYGHHRPHGDMALAYCLYHIESNNLAKITVYGEYLENHQSQFEVEIYEHSSWSCFHGVERWKSNCGCNTGMHPGWHQKWRAPLRQALDWLRQEIIPIYEQVAQPLMKDPWLARDDYISVLLNRSKENVDRFLAGHTKGDLSKDDKSKVLKLLELQRHGMLMYTSCGWFFDEISGIETTQVMQYAGRAIQLADELTGNSLEPEFIERLKKAPSNIPEFGNGGTVYERFIKPALLDLLRVGAHYAVSSLFEEYSELNKIYCYTVNVEIFDKVTAGRLELGIGRATISSDITWDESEITYAVLYLGGHILNGGVREFMGDDALVAMHHEIRNSFQKGDIPEVIRLMDDHFGSHNYSLWHLFKDEQRRVFDQILASVMEDVEVHDRQIYESTYSLFLAMQNMQIPLPQALLIPIQFILNTDVKMLLEEDEPDLKRLQTLVDEFKKLNIQPNKTMLCFVANQRISQLMENLSGNYQNTQIFITIKEMIALLNSLKLDLDLWETQNLFFIMGKQHFDEMLAKAQNGDEDASMWIEHFQELGNYLQVRIS